MRATIPLLGAVFSFALLAPAAHAQSPGGNCAAPQAYAPAMPPYSCAPFVPQAPDACGPGFYATNCCGCLYGPNYCLRPPFPPFNGMLPPPNNNGPAFPTHPFARGPRDFFMYER